jgi:phytol kinase
MKQKGMDTGYTRKIFHFIVFGTVAVLQWISRTEAVLVFGAMCSLVVFYAVWRGRDSMLYEALAREKDEPHRSCFVILPWLASLIGGVLTNVLFSSAVIAGYLVAGFGDAIGEPVGTKIGRHSYKAWSLSSVPVIRSIEGSTAVFIASAIAIFVAAMISPGIYLTHLWGVKILAIAAISALVEAFSPHGWDNLTMQIIPAGLVYLWMA